MESLKRNVFEVLYEVFMYDRAPREWPGVGRWNVGEMMNRLEKMPRV